MSKYSSLTNQEIDVLRDKYPVYVGDSPVEHSGDIDSSSVPSVNLQWSNRLSNASVGQRNQARSSRVAPQARPRRMTVARTVDIRTFPQKMTPVESVVLDPPHSSEQHESQSEQMASQIDVLTDLLNAGVPEDEIYFQSQLVSNDADPVNSNPVGGKEDQSGFSHDSL